MRIYIVLHYFKNITQLCKHNMAQMRALWICYLCYYEKQTETVMINHSTNINKANSHLSSSLTEHQQSEQSPLIITHRTSTKRSHLSSSLTEHQQSEQSPLIITHRTSKKTTPYDVGNPDPGLGPAQVVGFNRLIDPIPPFLITWSRTAIPILLASGAYVICISNLM